MDYEKKIRDYMNSSEVDQLYKSMLSNLFPELVEPKEEKARRSLLEFLEDLFKLGKNINFDRWSKADCEEWVNWVMKQGEQKPAEIRTTGYWNVQDIEQKTAEWTAEDEEELKIALDTLEEAGQYLSAKWLKNVCLVPQTMQKSWSEEDDSKLKEVLYYIEYVNKTNVTFQQRDLAHLINWLKSLKERVGCEVNCTTTWKPSEGQLECLGYAIDKAEHDFSPLVTNRIYLTLKGLREQLMKLKEG